LIALWNRHCAVALIAPVNGGRHELVIGFVAGLIARFLAPGPNNPQGFILTTILGIVGAFLATFIGQTIGWYRLDQGAERWLAPSWCCSSGTAWSCWASSRTRDRAAGCSSAAAGALIRSRRNVMLFS